MVNKKMVFGIDLGTGFSCISHKTPSGDIEVIPNKEGTRTTPSVVAFTKEGEKLVGLLAKRQAVVNPERTIEFIKRKMGSDYKVNIDGKTYTPQQISAFILQKLKEDAEEYVGDKVTDVVITVPAYFSDAQRTATKDAATIAGLNVLRIINEPTAAALCAGQTQKIEGKVLVIDSGCGTTDNTIMDISDGIFEVISTCGDNFLGGSDWDKVICDWLISEFKKSDGIDLSKDKTAVQRLMEASEKAKIELSTMNETTISLPFITADNNGPKHLEMTLSRSKFEQLSNELVNRFEKPLRQVMENAKLNPSDIDMIIFVGGSSRLPMLQAKVKEVMGKEACKNTNPDEAISIGATIQASIITGEQKDIVLVDVTPLSLGIETNGAVNTTLIDKNSAIPIIKKQIFTTAADNQPAVTIRICEGERPMFSDNILLGTFNLDGIMPAPRGIPQIEVTFDVDASGILTVSAKDLGTNKEQHITIQSSNLSDADIEKYKKEAEMYAEEDKKKKELIDTKNSAEMLKYTIEKMVKDNTDNKVLTDEEVSTLNDAVKTLDDAIKLDKAEDIKTAINNVNNIVAPISTRVYQEAAKNNPNAAAEAAAHMAGETQNKDAEPDMNKYNDIFKNAAGK
jgi:molecular chaperone DnaK